METVEVRITNREMTSLDEISKVLGISIEELVKLSIKRFLAQNVDNLDARIMGDISSSESDADGSAF